jgi:hypothetical protein
MKMINKKNIKTFSFAILFTLFIFTGIPVIAAPSQPAIVKDKKEVKAEKPVKQSLNLNLEKKEQANPPEIKQIKDVKKEKNPYADAEITIKVFPASNKTFGYDIILNNRPFIHQPHVPGMSGNDGFADMEKAQKVAEFVVKKIKNNEMPPTVTMDDLNRMGVLR